MYEFKSSLKVSLASGLRASEDLVGRERRISVFDKAIEVVVWPLQDHELNEFVLMTRELVD